jgi:4-amino-4-deoxy-L-arabinose transferase-like glycosyltransferase
MSEPPHSETEPRHRGVPQGYRQGLITAITVLLGFSLTFLRYWSFEAPGEWTTRSIIATIALGIAVLLQIVALVRSLRLEDDQPREYRITVRYFTCSTALLVLGLLLAAIVFAE